MASAPVGTIVYTIVWFIAFVSTKFGDMDTLAWRSWIWVAFERIVPETVTLLPLSLVMSAALTSRTERSCLVVTFLLTLTLTMTLALDEFVTTIVFVDIL